MAEGDGIFYNAFKKDVLDGAHDLDSGGHTIKAILVSSYTPNIDTHKLYSDVSGVEYGAGSGYTVGGETLGSQATTQDDANDRADWDGADTVWVSLGPLSPATPSDLILYNDTQTTPSKPLIVYFEIGVTATTGGNYTIQWHTDGIALLT